MEANADMLRNELRRLRDGAGTSESPSGSGTETFIVACRGDAQQVLSKVREVLSIVAADTYPDWPSDEQWMELMPEWFIARCVPPKSKDESERRLEWRRALPWPVRRRLAAYEKWSFSAWIYWFQPENRFWFWWDAREEGPDRIRVAVEVDELPFPWEALRWLFRAAGAIAMDTEE
jgi:hypothetical protein